MSKCDSNQCFDHDVTQPHSLVSLCFCPSALPEKSLNSSTTCQEDIWWVHLPNLKAQKYFRVCFLCFNVHLCLLTSHVASFAAQVSLKTNSTPSRLGKKEKKESKAILWDLMMNLKAELKLKTYRLCSPSSVLLNETQSAPLYANAPRRFFFCLSFFLSFLLFLNISFPCSYSGGKIFFLFFYSQQWGKSSRLSVCSETAAALKKKKGKKSTQTCGASQGKRLKLVRQCHEHLQTSGRIFFLLFSRDSWMNANVTCAWHLPVAFPPDQSLYPREKVMATRWGSSQFAGCT